MAGFVPAIFVFHACHGGPYSAPAPSLTTKCKNCSVAVARRRARCAYTYLEVRCLGSDTHQTVALIDELERYMRCKDCSEVRGYPYKRSHLVALRRTKISASDPPSYWWPGER